MLSAGRPGQVAQAGGVEALPVRQLQCRLDDAHQVGHGDMRLLHAHGVAMALQDAHAQRLRGEGARPLPAVLEIQGFRSRA